MKKKDLTKKLNLKKNVITKLNNENLDSVNGGMTGKPCYEITFTTCKTIFTCVSDFIPCITHDAACI